MEKPNVSRETKKVGFGSIRDAINSRLLKLLGPVAVAGLMVSITESAKAQGFEKLGTPEFINELNQQVASKVADFVEMAKKERKTNFEGLTTEGRQAVLEIDTINNGMSLKETVGSGDYVYSSYLLDEGNFYFTTGSRDDGPFEFLKTDQETGTVLAAEGESGTYTLNQDLTVTGDPTSADFVTSHARRGVNIASGLVEGRIARVDVFDKE
jgi:hypothetical protein